MNVEDIFNAEIEVLGTCRCGQPATVLWPAIKGNKLQEAMCRKCTDKEKEKLLIALGSQGFIPTQYQ